MKTFLKFTFQINCKQNTGNIVPKCDIAQKN